MTPAEQAARFRSGHEPERKFRVHGLFRIPDLATLPGVTAVDHLGTVEFDSTYFDTADLRLTREGITVRRRFVRHLGGETYLGGVSRHLGGETYLGGASSHLDGETYLGAGDDEGWLLVLPDAGAGHHDIRRPLDGHDRPPASLTGLVRVVVRGAVLTPVSTLRTTRERRLVRTAGRDLAEVVDDTVFVVDADGSVAARFRELALTEIDGEALAERVAAALTDAGAVGGEFVAKVVRALGPAAAAPPEVPEPRPAQAGEPAGYTLAAHLTRHVRELRAADIASRRDPADPEAVHRLRVAARRLRSGLRTFQPLVDKEWSKRLRTELAWFARGLGDLREGDVLQERLIRHCDELPDVRPRDEVRALLADVLGSRVTAARARIRTLMDSRRYLDLHEELVAAVQQTPVTATADEPARDVLPPLVAKEWTRLARACAGLSADAPDEQWHTARLEAKRARYAAEAVAPTLGSDAKAFAKRIEKLTDILGEHQDAAQAAATARELAASTDAPPDVASALGVLASNERAHVYAARTRFATVWPQVRRPKWRRWLP